MLPLLVVFGLVLAISLAGKQLVVVIMVVAEAYIVLLYVFLMMFFS